MGSTTYDPRDARDHEPEEWVMGQNPMNSEIIETMMAGAGGAMHSNRLSDETLRAMQMAALQALLDGGWVVEKAGGQAVLSGEDHFYADLKASMEEEDSSSRDQSPSTTRAPLASELADPQSGGAER